jgi:hypothetical protein
LVFSVLHQKLGLLGSCFAAKFKLLFCFSRFLCTTRSRRRRKRRKRKWVCSSFVIDRLLQWENMARERPRMWWWPLWRTRKSSKWRRIMRLCVCLWCVCVCVFFGFLVWIRNWWAATCFF